MFASASTGERITSSCDKVDLIDISFLSPKTFECIILSYLSVGNQLNLFIIINYYHLHFAFYFSVYFVHLLPPTTVFIGHKNRDQDDSTCNFEFMLVIMTRHTILPNSTPIQHPFNLEAYWYLIFPHGFISNSNQFSLLITILLIRNCNPAFVHPMNMKKFMLRRHINRSIRT